MVEEKEDFNLVKIDIQDETHQQALLSLMNDYMLDDMGLHSPLPEELGVDIINGLKEQNNYLGFLLKYGGEFIALANCFIAFSTFKAKQLINIHDYVVSPKYRGLGAGKALLEKISDYVLTNNYCKITLEVRHDNPKAQNLYNKLGFEECDPPMYFWQKTI
ncbi:GNAT family N-acetyltransferase [Labilibacter marinus]|uniref:GNAT family N-acetyltransferase n=1 Tax=Labilibacter marinus TaxID=1477105 RepID=UPI00083639D5|nr:GNAT family N-acetyltransferase [Labilibacter marinus]